MKLIYIAGKFRGATPWLVEGNVRAAEIASLEVARSGHVPVCPHTMYRYFDKQLTDAFWLGATLDLLRRCDAILMLPDWESSTGATMELDEARRLELPIFTLETLPSVIR